MATEDVSERLPGVVVIGGMKCGTTALHGYLADHPAIAPSAPKELNFFFGERPGGPGNWWRGVRWYAARFSGDGIPMEASPGYTSPDHPDTAARMAELLPDARLLYLSRDPLERAVSQYRHHRRDGAERRPLGEALRDPASQYVSRSRHHDRLRPFLEHFPEDRIAIVGHADLLRRRRDTLRAVFRWLGIDEHHWRPTYAEEHNVATAARPDVPDDLRAWFRAAVADDALAFRRLRRRLGCDPRPVPLPVESP